MDDCADLSGMMTRLEGLRKADDRIHIQLNSQLTQRGADCSKACADIRKELNTLHGMRLALLTSCLSSHVQHLNQLEKGSPQARLLTGTIRQIRSELEVEEIVSSRSERTVDERCRGF